MSGPPIAEIRAVIDPQLNGVILEGFACGMYTLLLGQAIWQLHTTSNKGFYSFALILLWISEIFTFATDWSTARAGFIDHNTSPFDIANGLQPVIPLLGEFAHLVGIVLSDSILVWRCHILWRNRYLLIFLVMILITTAVIMLCDDFLNNVNLIAPFTTLVAFFSFMTTVSATSLIAWKIASLTRESHIRHSYTKVLQILVESAALVSVVLSGVFILSLIDAVHIFNLGTMRGKVMLQMASYFGYMQGPVIGIAPTLIAFRVAKGGPLQTEINGTNPPSHLRFRRAADNNNVTPRTMVSTMEFGPSQGEDSLSTVQTRVDMETTGEAQESMDKP
ncbi:hypothetical protein D9619_000016 [Psilocybe cf. subviscida]|uniref:Uncharacterized protein n=1 Tax=Psilocybe cf. subviscida TaxID=2480587 RepID=A0A8H5F324_9AGAR|nr:hypothetical protein D9619_000016 [Psilocybe cf. subviscida]